MKIWVWLIFSVKQINFLKKYRNKNLLRELTNNKSLPLRQRTRNLVLVWSISLLKISRFSASLDAIIDQKKSKKVLPQNYRQYLMKWIYILLVKKLIVTLQSVSINNLTTYLFNHSAKVRQWIKPNQPFCAWFKTWMMMRIVEPLLVSTFKSITKGGISQDF